MNGIIQETVRRGSDTKIKIVVHPSPSSPNIIVSCPGYRSDIHGYNYKYVVLGKFLAEKGIGAFVQMENIERPASQYGPELLADFRAVIGHAISVAIDICVTDEPHLYLMGFSAGGWATATVAGEYSRVKKILLMEPSASESLLGKFPRDALSQYKGETYIVLGDHDGVGERVGWLYYESFKQASLRKLVMIENCDHQFKGKANGQIMAKAPLWAFGGDKTFPSPEGGLVLYD